MMAYQLKTDGVTLEERKDGTELCVTITVPVDAVYEWRSVFSWCRYNKLDGINLVDDTGNVLLNIQPNRRSKRKKISSKVGVEHPLIYPGDTAVFRKELEGIYLGIQALDSVIEFLRDMGFANYAGFFPYYGDHRNQEPTRSGTRVFSFSGVCPYESLVVDFEYDSPIL
jgi:hypothetical protein